MFRDFPNSQLLLQLAGFAPEAVTDRVTIALFFGKTVFEGTAPLKVQFSHTGINGNGWKRLQKGDRWLLPFTEV